MTNEEIYIKDRMGKKEPFRVPEGYFDNLVGEVMAKLPERQTEQQKVKPLYERLRPLLYVAACLVFAVLSVTIYLSGDNDESSMQIASQSAPQSDTYYEDVADYVMVDNNDIYACLTNE